MLTSEVAKEIKGKGKLSRIWIYMDRKAAESRPNQRRSPTRRTGAGPLHLPAKSGDLQNRHAVAAASPSRQLCCPSSTSAFWVLYVTCHFNSQISRLTKPIFRPDRETTPITLRPCYLSRTLLKDETSDVFPGERWVHFACRLEYKPSICLAEGCTVVVTDATHQYVQLFASQSGRAALPVPLGLGGTRSSLLIVI